LQVSKPPTRGDHFILSSDLENAPQFSVSMEAGPLIIGLLILTRQPSRYAFS
jgi:hypothetical protein